MRSIHRRLTVRQLVKFFLFASAAIGIVFGSVVLPTAAATAATTSSTRALTESEKTSDVEQFFQLIKSSYGPLRFKESDQGINVESLRAKYLELARETQSNSEFYYMLGRLIAEFRDSHFSVNIPSRMRASLGFSVDLVEGKVLVDQITNYKGPYTLAKGDEIVTVDGAPVAAAVEGLMSYVSSGFEGTRRRTAAMMLTQRNGARVPVPRGNITLGVRKSDATMGIDTVSIPWMVDGSPLDERISAPFIPAVASGGPGYLKNFQLDVVSEMRGLLFADAEQSFRCSGRTRTKIPDGAVMIQESPFVAYYHPVRDNAHDGRTVNIGYLRIPHYMPSIDKPGSEPTEDSFREYYARYEYAVAELEAHTDGLIIDQDHNCGGSVDYLENLVGLFMDKPYPGLQFSFLATKQEYLEFSQELDHMIPQSLPYKYFKSVTDLMRASWERGEAMTPKTSFFGDQLHAPNASTRYTKPIVMLIDELSGSGGDAFPSIMQGLGRAKLLGTRTMGAGGHVVAPAPLYHSAVGMRITKSLFYRPDGVAVENNGAVPDFDYAPTRNDFMNGYADYQRFYLEKLLQQLQ